MSVKAAGEQGTDLEGAFLRRLRVAIMCERRFPDSPGSFEGLAAEAGLDVRRFGIDLESTATLESFGADLEAAREAGGETPTGLFRPAAERDGPASPGVAGDIHRVGSGSGFEEWRGAALAAGARPVRTARPSITEAIERFGPLSGAELKALTGLPEPVLEAELWSGAREWRYRPSRYLTGTIWEPVGSI